MLPLRPPAAPEPVAIVRGQGGASVITKVEPSASIPLVWIVDGFDRDAIDLEALRPHLTDAAILAACRKHLDARGPSALPGFTSDQWRVAEGVTNAFGRSCSRPALCRSSPPGLCFGPCHPLGRPSAGCDRS